MVQTSKSFLPREFTHGHDFAFLLHDILVELLRSGEEHNIFNTALEFKDDEDRIAFEQAENLFVWLQNSRRFEDRANILRVTVFPAILSDMLHFIYAALENSRKAKLTVTYALLRKPLQENLFIMESIARDPVEFAEQFSTDPFRLRATKMGGAHVHSRLIGLILEDIGISPQFDASYVAQLRYEKNDEGFDGICNRAVHLFTEHPKIRTEALNMNLVFSDWEAKQTQWAYLYSRLPYLLAYTREIVEHVCERIVPTDPSYLEDLRLRVAGSSLLWWESVSSEYRTVELERFVDAQEQWLSHYCNNQGWNSPSQSDLEKIASKGRCESLLDRLRNSMKRFIAFIRHAANSLL